MGWQPNEAIGAYTLENQIGQGGMATVYKAYHAELDRHVAIKVMHQNFLEDESFVARFKREAQILARLHHAHIVPIYDYGEHEGRPYLVMQYIQGYTLKRRMIKKPLSLSEVLKVMAAVGSALSYAHKKGVLHRDIKPSNIIVDTEGTPYLTDFGLARLAASGESTMSADMLLGTPHYISPEQARGQKDLDGRADIYSLGVVLYEMLVGTVPFTADTPFAIIHDHIYTPLPRPSKINPEIPASVEMVLYRAMEKKPDDRYQTTEAFIKDLRTAIADDRLTSLNPERVSVAAQSIAQYRQERGSSVARMHTPALEPQPQAVPAPAATDAGGSAAFATVTLGAQQKWYQQERIWPLGGCAALLLILFVGLGIVLNMSANLLELVELVNRPEPPAPTRPGSSAIEDIPELFVELGVTLSESEYPVYSIPAVTDEDMQRVRSEYPAHPLTYLLQAQRLWRSDPQQALQAIAQGLSFTEDATRYLVSAALMANAAEQYDAALIYVIVALQTTLDNQDMETFAQIRPGATEYIYTTAARDDVRLLNLQTLLNTVLLSNTDLDFDLTHISTSSPANLALAANRLARERTNLVNGLLLRIEREALFDEEVLLLRGQYELLLGNEERAQDAWQSLLDSTGVPAWVTQEAQTLLAQFDR